MNSGDQEFLQALLIAWVIHAIPALIIAIPTVLLTRKKLTWLNSDSLAIVLPWLLWFFVFGFAYWPIKAIPALIIALPTVLLTRKKLTWRSRDSLAFALAWLLWFLVLVFASGSRSGASLASALVENLLLGSAVGLSFVAFAVLAKRFNPDKLRLVLLALLCSVAFLLSAFFPFIGE